MTLPTDAIVVIYYSGSVNVASTNSESLPKTPLQVVYLEGRNTRHSDIPFRVPTGSEVLVLAETIARKVFRPITESLVLSEVDTRKTLPKVAGETLHLTESVLRRVIPHIAEILVLAETSIVRKIARKLSETLGLVESVLKKVTRRASLLIAHVLN